MLQKIVIGLFALILVGGGLAVSGCSIDSSTHTNVNTGAGDAGDTSTKTSNDGDETTTN